MYKKGGATRMPFIRDDLMQPVCLTIVYNLSTGALISSTINSNECVLDTEFDFETKNLTIRVPFIVEGILSINDNFQSSCVTKNIFQPTSPIDQQKTLMEIQEVKETKDEKKDEKKEKKK